MKFKPIQVLKRLLQWICLEIVLLLAQKDVWAQPEGECAHTLHIYLHTCVLCVYVYVCIFGFSFSFVDLTFTDGTTTIRPDDTVEDTGESKKKIDLEPCDKVATLYVMDQKFEPPTNYDSHE